MNIVDRVILIIALGIAGFTIGFLAGELAKAETLDDKYKIAIIDTGFTFVPFSTAGFKLCDSGHYDFDTNTATVGEDTIGHGAYVTALVNHYANSNKICFMIYKVFGKNVRNGHKAIDSAMIKAYKAGAKAINMSLYMTQYSERTRKIVRHITKNGVKIFVSSGNSGTDMNKTCYTYPVCYKGINKNMVVVGATDYYGRVARYSNVGTRVDIYQYGDLGRARGTSFASPRALGDYIRSLNLDGR